MVIYADLAIVLNFAVDLCLLLGANRLSGYSPGWKRALPAAGLGSVYAAVCLIPPLGFLGDVFWRILVLLAMSFIAFGASPSGLRRGILFVFLSMALGGVAAAMGKGGLWGTLAAAAAICAICLLGFREPIGQSRYVSVDLIYQGRKMSLTALYDTGNLLRDPITGQGILLVGADVGFALAGLSDAALSDPVSAVGQGRLAGARLIPYRAVGKESGMLLALPLDEVWIDGRKSGRLVAFAPNVLCARNTYQALTGGVI